MSSNITDNMAIDECNDLVKSFFDTDTFDIFEGLKISWSDKAGEMPPEWELAARIIKLLEDERAKTHDRYEL